MRVTLSFKLPEEQEEFELAQKAGHLSGVIDNLDNYLRSKIKYEDHPEAIHAIYEEIRSKLWELNDE